MRSRKLMGRSNRRKSKKIRSRKEMGRSNRKKRKKIRSRKEMERSNKRKRKKIKSRKNEVEKENKVEEDEEDEETRGAHRVSIRNSPTVVKDASSSRKQIIIPGFHKPIEF